MSDNAAAAAEVKFTLKVFINKQKNKVLCAEADNDFTDVLLSFLTLPLGRIMKVLEGHYGDKAPVVGSLTTLYKGLSNLKQVDFWNYSKCRLLNPYLSFEARRVKLKLRVNHPQDTNRKKSLLAQAFTDGSPLVTEGDIVEGLTIKSASFTITDDLLIAPVVPGSILQTLINVGITDPDEAELRILTLGFSEIVDLLKGCLLSKTPLTDLVFNERGKIDCITENLLQEASKGLSSSSSKKMTVQAMVHNSTNKILFVEADDEFVDFLYSFLVVPLGAVEYLLGGKTCLKNIDNFYKSIAKIDDDKFLNTKATKAMLLKPRLAESYTGHTFFLPFAAKGLLSSKSAFYFRGEKFGGQNTMYNVTDDLVVTPFSMASSFSLLSQFKIPLSNVNEVELVIGLDEALRIFKASLTSNTALTDALMNSIPNKQPKHEH